MGRFNHQLYQTPPRLRYQRQRGFTLIEVMVALVIVSIALAALTRSMGLTVNNQGALENRVIATWVAQDELVKLQVMPQSRPEQRVLVKALNRNWLTELSTEDTLIPSIKKATMTVTLEGEKKPAASLVTVIGP